MSDLFNVADPRGKNVKCTKDCWYGHVINRRPFLNNYIRAVKTTIRKPSFINSDRFSLTTENYYRKVVRPNGGFYYRVTVEFYSGSGEVRTEYKCDSTKNGEVQIWP
jgi:hypothetical protein